MSVDSILSPVLPRSRSRVRVPQTWLPYAVLALFALAVLAVLWLIYRHETELQRNTLRQDLQSAEIALTRKLLAHQEFSDRLAGALSSGEKPESLTEQTEIYVKSNPEISQVLWTSDGAFVRWVVPVAREPTEVVRSRPHMTEIERMLRLTAATGRATYTDPYVTTDGEAFVEYHSPVHHGERYFGTLCATISLRVLVQTMVPTSVLDKYRIAITDHDGHELYATQSGQETFDSLTLSENLTLPWRNLQLRATSYRTRSAIGQTALFALTLLLLGVLAWSLNALRRRATLQVAADNAVKAAHERFVTVLDALEAAVYVTDIETHEILFVNENFGRFFPGRSLGDNADAVEGQLVPPPSRAMRDQELVDAAGEPANAEKEEVRDVASGNWYLVRAKAIRWVDGRIVRMNMVSDITDRKEAQERSRVQQEKLLLTSRLMSVGEMASTLAHEINQPLAAIANYNMGAVRRLKSDQWKKEELVLALEKSAAQAERAGRVVQRVREFLRRREPAREALDINAVIEDVIELIELEAEKAGVIVSHVLAPDLAPVFADRIMIEQVLLNLIKNGIDAMGATPFHERRMAVTTEQSG
ncbi:MAG TPA: histidine kinase dimerization/phospho-acceptor domain-containing protein, partial [Burkholderiales bacterium]|nr:histidine kinase dimerization/phospho-acceptor domain-containing protein [Burkholderiales bacterium]